MTTRTWKDIQKEMKGVAHILICLTTVITY